ncbi:MAG TPA: cupredoxin domain-containing protein [Longimicrobiales bacterium]
MRRTNVGRIVTGFASLALALATLACSDDGTGPADDNPPAAITITMNDNTFSPQVDTVAVNGTVTWTNQGQSAHTTTSEDGDWDSQAVDPGESYDHQFTTAGTYAYECTFHPGMTGTIVVR